MMKINEEAARCMLCHASACTAACDKGMIPSSMIRAVRFENPESAGQFVKKSVCAACNGMCEDACIHYDRPLRIREMAQLIPEYYSYGDVDLSVDFMGVHCENPFFLSSSIVASNYEMCAKALGMGWGGVVFKTVGFLKPKEVSPRFDAVGKEGTPFVGFKNLEQISEHSLEENLEIFRCLKSNFPNKVIVASIMGQTDEEWYELSRLVTEAGVDIIECNFSCPHMMGHGLGSDVGQDPELVAKYTSIVKSATHLPVLAKMTPNIGNMEIPAHAAVNAGADGIAAINTIKSLTGVVLETNEPRPSISGKSAVSGYSGKAVKPIALRFINDIAKCMPDIPISGMGGIETWHDAAEFIALGCGNIQVTTAVMQYGYRIIDDLKDGLKRFMTKSGIKSVSDMIGMSLEKIVAADQLDRDTIVYPAFNRKKCIGCGRCYVSCYDAGHQAIEFNAGERKPILHAAKCAGCHLCMLVCPAAAIAKGNRVKKV